MTPVLIYTDTQKIANKKAVLNKAVALYQAVYDAFYNVGTANGSDPIFILTLDEIYSLVSRAISNVGNDYVKNFALDKLVSIGNGGTINGIKISPSKFRELIDCPDVTAVNVALQQVGRVFNTDCANIEVSLLQMLGGEVGPNIFKADDTDATIEAQYTYYTKSDASATLATSIQAICTALNTHSGSYPEFFNRIKNAERGVPLPIPGIIRASTAFVVDLNYIRRFEAQGII